jgi:hypothetical protein
MSPSEPLPNVMKMLGELRLPQQSISSFLNETLKKVQPSLRLEEVSGGISQRIASMTTAADLSRQLLRSFEPASSSIQKAISEAARGVAAYHITDSIAKAA